ncbi:hypothetical protein JVU11DRAFT_1446 [Chiua virens]|nr:hypothetical protein JVU11DRAFT_1446 [Chiua virens]
MSDRGRSPSLKPLHDADVDMDNVDDKKDVKVVVVNGLSRNVAQTHLQTIFGFYGEVVKIDLPLYTKSGQNRGKASLEYADPSSARKAASHMNGGQLDGLVLKVELSDVPIRTRSRSRPRPVLLAFSFPLPDAFPPSSQASVRATPLCGYISTNKRLWSSRPLLQGTPTALLVLARVHQSGVVTASHRDGGHQATNAVAQGMEGAGRSRSRSYSVRSSRSRSVTPSRSRSRSRSRSPSYSSYSRYSRSRTRSRSPSRGKRSHSREDIRDSRSRSPA